MKTPIFWFYLVILLLLSSFLFFLKISDIPISDGDTFYYINIAKNILKTGNWLDLKAEGHLFPKPPLVVWLIAISFKIFGANLFSVNFWHILLGIGVVLLTYILGLEMFNLRTGFFAGLILTTSALFFYQVRSPLLDIPLLFFLNLSFLFFWFFLKYKKIQFFYFFEIAVGFLLLVKGLVGPFLVLLVVVPFSCFLARSHFKIFKKQIFSSIFLVVLVFISWFVRQYFIFGIDFLKMLFTENIVRFFHPIDGPTRAPQLDFYAYFLYLIVCFIPWSGFGFSAFWYFLKNRKKEEEHWEARHFIFLWFFLIFLFFSISMHYKIPRYILPVFPALALMVGYLFDQALLNEINFKKYLSASALLTLLIVIPGAIAGYYWLKFQFPAEFVEYRPMFLNFIFLYLGGLGIASLIAFIKKIPQSALIIFVTFFLVAYISYIYLIGSAVKYYNQLIPYLVLARKNPDLSVEEIIKKYNLKEGRQDLEFYLNR